MTSIVLSVQDEGMLTQIKRACQLLKGVSQVKVYRTPAKISDITQTAHYRKAMEDVRQGRVTEYESTKDMFEKLGMSHSARLAYDLGAER